MPGRSNKTQTKKPMEAAEISPLAQAKKSNNGRSRKVKSKEDSSHSILVAVPQEQKAPESPKAADKVAIAFTTPTRARPNGSAQSATPKKRSITPRKLSEDENVNNSNNVVTSPSGLIRKGSFGKGPKVPLADPKVQRVYKLINKSTGALGGNGYDGAIYGELTMGSMQKVIDVLVGMCEMTPQSRFIDVGSGLGKPNFHAAQSPGVRVSVGIELERIRWQLAMYNLKQILPHVQGYLSNDAADTEDAEKLQGGVHFLCGDIFDTVTMDPFTHVYMYDLGFPPPLQQKIASNFNTSVHCQYLVSYRPPHRIINEYGYEVTPVAQVPTSMTGSGEIHTAYFYKRSSKPHPLREKSGVSIIELEARPGVEDDKPLERIACDDLFKESVLLAAGPANTAEQNVTEAVKTLISCSRPIRERKQRVLSTL